MTTEPTSVSESNGPAASHLKDPIFLEDLRGIATTYAKDLAEEDSSDGAPGASDTTG